VPARLDEVQLVLHEAVPSAQGELERDERGLAR
jgi:hypothetical protein